MTADSKNGKLFSANSEINNLFQKAFRNSPSGLLIFDDKRLLAYANNYMLDLFTKTEKDITGKKFCELFLCTEKDISNCITCPLMESVNVVLDTGEPFSLKETYHEFIKNGRIDRLWFKLHAESYSYDGNNYVIVSLADITKQKYLENNLRNLGITDGQTLLYYRKFILEQLEILATDASLTESPLTLVMMDIDNLNEINESQGYETGDAIIENLARIISETIRHTDFAGRYGGEEFLLLLPDTTKDGGASLTERIMKLLGEMSFGTLDKPVTFSAGILEINQPDINISHFLVNTKILLLRNKEDRSTGWYSSTMSDFD